MNKKTTISQTISSLLSIADELDKSKNYDEADTLTKIASSIIKKTKTAQNDSEPQQNMTIKYNHSSQLWCVIADNGMQQKTIAGYPDLETAQRNYPNAEMISSLNSHGEMAAPQDGTGDSEYLDTDEPEEEQEHYPSDGPDSYQNERSDYFSRLQG